MRYVSASLLVLLNPKHSSVFSLLRSAQVQHCLKAHFGDASVTWECLSPKDTTQAHLFEIMECVSRGFHSSAKQKIWRCLKCRDTTSDTGRMNWDTLAEHFRRNPCVGHLHSNLYVY
jgi:hypothetical protein